MCTGQETDISSCRYLDVDDCGAGEGVGVVCTAKPTSILIFIRKYY
jgi:hypothetical protein